MWSNLDVAPAYSRRILTYRLRNEVHAHEFVSDADVRTWLPGTWEMQDRLQVPADLPLVSYLVEVAVFDRAGTNPDTRPLPPLQLGIAGRDGEGW